MWVKTTMKEDADMRTYWIKTLDKYSKNSSGLLCCFSQHATKEIDCYSRWRGNRYREEEVLPKPMTAHYRFRLISPSTFEELEKQWSFKHRQQCKFGFPGSNACRISERNWAMCSQYSQQRVTWYQAKGYEWSEHYEQRIKKKKKKKQHVWWMIRSEWTKNQKRQRQGRFENGKNELWITRLSYHIAS